MRCTDLQHPKTGLGAFSDLSREQLDAREQVTHELVTMEEAANRQWDAGRLRYCTGAKRVTAERADDALNCLPPYRWSRGDGTEIFAVGEPITDSLVSWFVRLGGDWFELVEDRRIGYDQLLWLVRESDAFKGENQLAKR